MADDTHDIHENLDDVAAAPVDESQMPRLPASTEDAEFDSANKSLTSALRISFYALQFVMVVLIGVYVFSGWRNVPEQSRGLRLLFGRIQDTEALEAGGYFTWPYPIGQFILVPKAVQTVELNRSFWIGLSGAEQNTPFRSLNAAARTSLNPAEDGSVITADYNLAHTRWRVQYQIEDARSNQEQMALALVPILVGKAVERGVVLGSAETTLDDLIQVPDGVRSKVRMYAQEYLDRVGGGIRITSVTLNDAFPPLPVLEAYESVNQASVVAAQNRVEAQQRSSVRLTGMAGPAYNDLRRLINEYDELIALSKSDANLEGDAAAKLAEIDELLMSEHVGGRVATLIGQARSERGEFVATYRADLERFLAWRERYEQSPELTRSLLWAETMRRVAMKDIEWFGMPASLTQLDLLINPDPERRRNLERNRNLNDLEALY